MYRPNAFDEPRLALQHQLIREFPLGWLTVHGPQGLVADPVPFLLDDAPGERGLGTLRGHLARANPMAAALREATACLIVFQGPQAYVTPSWYPSKLEHGKAVPTWNYAAVQVHGTPAVVDDAGWLRAQVDGLTRQMETDREHPWSVDDAPPAFVEAMLRAVVGVEIPIQRIEGKWKVSQNRPASDREGVVSGLLREAERPAHAMARAMAALVAAHPDIERG
ncbi:FMN-binding negative transcriptional regulator [Cupriavidus sp. AU9028]|uniref:FMN-binding negative transcriptional regulator n=1 Tax=Cupriavidus sp. AU9028 TaxID=2871157 RepID=UPI001C964E24|nr:FMN-binding negative transcriptional regulator [Cupriavidus sp. AU9028]MBY4896123.1 FMN-binding negative transcriptional regulator [Cupriavidus sp. AU9028]